MAKKLNHQFLDNYWHATNDIAYKFIKKYFGKEEAELFKQDNILKNSDWVDWETRHSIQIGDFFFNINFMIECLMWEVKKKDMFDYYDYSIDLAIENINKKEDDKEIIWNLKHWLAANRGYKGII